MWQLFPKKCKPIILKKVTTGGKITSMRSPPPKCSLIQFSVNCTCDTVLYIILHTELPDRLKGKTRFDISTLGRAIVFEICGPVLAMWNCVSITKCGVCCFKSLPKVKIINIGIREPCFQVSWLGMQTSWMKKGWDDTAVGFRLKTSPEAWLAGISDDELWQLNYSEKHVAHTAKSLR